MRRTEEQIRNDYLVVNAKIGEIVVQVPEAAEVLKLFKKLLELQSEFNVLKNTPRPAPLSQEEANDLDDEPQPIGI